MNIYDATSRYLARTMRCSKEIENKLRSLGFNEENINTVIKEYSSLGYINDSQYAKQYFQVAFAKGRSKARATKELLAKGINRSDIENGYEMLSEEQLEGEEMNAFFDSVEMSDNMRAEEQLYKMLRKDGLSIDDEIEEKIYGRYGRKLFSLGYSPSIVYGILNKIKRVSK